MHDKAETENDKENGKDGGQEEKIEKKNREDSAKFNWVSARSGCSLPKTFKDLLTQVEGDVKTRNGLRPNNSPYEFSVTEDGSDFKVLLKAGDVQKTILFSLTEQAILVRDDKGVQMFQVTLAFNDRGECKLYVNEEEREAWQVRQMALEDLMFRGY